MNKKPRYMIENFHREFNYRTRSAAAGENETEGRMQIPVTQKTTTKKGMMVRGPTEWNKLPRKLRVFAGSLASFKKELKKWIKKNKEP